jgi:DNA-binding transcriptional LysR family regulator
MLNVKRLAVFRTVVRTGSISAAARHLHVSQPAITKTIRLLEEELGWPLFLRVSGRLILTPEAEELMSSIERMFGSVGAVQQMADEIRDGFSGSISIATVMTLSPTLVAKAVERFHHQYPRVRFDISALPTRLVNNAVDTHQVDMGIVDSPKIGADMEVVELCRSETGCVMRADHPLARHKRLGPVDIAPYTLISFSNETFPGWQLRSALHDAQTGGQVIFTVNNSHTAYTLVQAGVGIGVVDTFPMFTGAFPDLVILPFLPLIQTNPHVAFSRSHAVPQIAHTFVEILKRTTNDLIDASAGMLKPPTTGPLRKKLS